jgi:hypothetical protein
MTSPRFHIGTSQENMVDLSTLGLVDPMPDYQPYTKDIPLESLGVLGVGSAQASWAWTFAPAAGVTALRAYRTGVTTYSLFIRTWVPQTQTYSLFEVDMIWPKKERESAGRFLDFSLAFVSLVFISETENPD